MNHQTTELLLALTYDPTDPEGPRYLHNNKPAIRLTNTGGRTRYTIKFKGVRYHGIKVLILLYANTLVAEQDPASLIDPSKGYVWGNVKYKGKEIVENDNKDCKHLAAGLWDVDNSKKWLSHVRYCPHAGQYIARGKHNKIIGYYPSRMNAFQALLSYEKEQPLVNKCDKGRHNKKVKDLREQVSNTKQCQFLDETDKKDIIAYAKQQLKQLHLKTNKIEGSE